MAPHDGLVHPKEYDIKDSNVELINSELDHKVKYNSAATEPAWNNGTIGAKAGLYVWRIEEFQVVAWPREKYGQFYDGDSYIVLHTYKLGSRDSPDDPDKLGHDVFFWLGAHTTQDEAGTAAYKTVELDEFLHGAATQYREVQDSPSDEFLSLFPRVTILSGGVRSGFRHVEEETPQEVTTLLRVFKNPGSASSNGVVVYEVEPHWRSLDDTDVFVLDKGDKIWVWQGKGCSPMEKAKAAQVVHDMTLAKHIDVEVLSQAESRSARIIQLLGGDESTPRDGFTHPRPILGHQSQSQSQQQADADQRLFRLSDASGQLSFELAKEGGPISKRDLDGNDVFLLDLGGRAIWVWEGKGASRAEKAQWLHVARAYLQYIQGQREDAHLIPLAKVNEGSESKAFLKAISV